MSILDNSFYTGDIVSHNKYGKGIILGDKQIRRGYNDQDMAFYHVKYEKLNTFGYAYSLKLVSRATEESAKRAKEILLNVLNNANARFHRGDLVLHPKFGEGLILGNYHKRGGRYYYNVYYENTKNAGYNATFSLIKEADKNRVNKAKHILISSMIEAYSCDTN